MLSAQSYFRVDTPDLEDEAVLFSFSLGPLGFSVATASLAMSGALE